MITNKRYLQRKNTWNFCSIYCTVYIIVFTIIFLLIIITYSFDGGIKGETFTAIGVIVAVVVAVYQSNYFLLSQFESRFITLLNLHRKNVSEFKINNISDKEVFVLLIQEYSYVYKIVNACYIRHNESEKQRKHDIAIIAYLILFFGIQKKDDLILKRNLGGYIKNLQMEALIDSLLRIKKISRNLSKKEYPYVYFDGHQTRLAHYYRHLYQTMTYLNDNYRLSVYKKIEYSKILRAQFSNYEQALFFLNSISPLGLTWWQKEYISTYKLVKNIPEDFYSNYEIDIDLKSYFQTEALKPRKNKEKSKYKYFEWESYKSHDYYSFQNGCITEMTY